MAPNRPETPARATERSSPLSAPVSVAEIAVAAQRRVSGNGAAHELERHRVEIEAAAVKPEPSREMLRREPIGEV